MSPIGRIFVVVNLVLAAAFLGWAGAVLAKSDQFKKQYLEEVAKHATTKTEKDSRINTVTGERDEARTSLAAIREERTRYQGEADRLKGELAGAKTENGQLRGAVDGINGKLGDFQQNLNTLNTRVAELDKDKSKLMDERERAVKAQAEAENEKENALEEMRRGKETLGGLQTTVASLSEERDKLKAQRDAIVALTGVSLETLLAQPFIEAHVLEVLADPGLVALSVGSDDGVMRGFSFDVFRGSTYKGKVVVESVDKKISSAKIALRAAGATIEKGDRAATRLP